jgi:hypothetical protein
VWPFILHFPISASSRRTSIKTAVGKFTDFSSNTGVGLPSLVEFLSPAPTPQRSLLQRVTAISTNKRASWGRKPKQKKKEEDVTLTAEERERIAVDLCQNWSATFRRMLQVQVMHTSVLSIAAHFHDELQTMQADPRRGQSHADPLSIGNVPILEDKSFDPGLNALVGRLDSETFLQV